MKAPNNFDASKFLEDISKEYPIVEEYFCREQLEIMDSIDSLYEMLNIENEIIPLTVMQMMEK